MKMIIFKFSAGVGRVGSVKTKAVFSFNYKFIIEIIITPPYCLNLVSPSHVKSLSED